jgi:hypothetical protein
MRIPVVWSGGQWRQKVISPIEFNEGAVGELIVDSSGITERAPVIGANARQRVVVLPAGAELRIALTIEPNLAGSLRGLLVQGDTAHDETARGSDRTRFISLWLRGSNDPDLRWGAGSAGLWFVFKGMDLLGIGSGMVDLPKALPLEPVESLGQAFTRLSEIFEPWRTSHTGDIYEHIYFCELDGRWAPLERLRERAVQERWTGTGVVVMK